VVFASQGVRSTRILVNGCWGTLPHERYVEGLCASKAKTRQRRQGQIERDHNEGGPGGGRGEDERKGCGAKDKAVAVDQAVTCRPHMLRRACLCADAQVYLSCGYVYKVAWNRLSTLASLRMCSAFPWRPAVSPRTRRSSSCPPLQLGAPSSRPLPPPYHTPLGSGFP